MGNLEWRSNKLSFVLPLKEKYKIHRRNLLRAHHVISAEENLVQLGREFCVSVTAYLAAALVGCH